MTARLTLAHAALMVITLLLAGCEGPGKPRTRLGALPFPGAFTLYDTADPENLGQHRSTSFPPYPMGPYENQRGIVYTRHAGFLDIAHVRETIDWTRYCTAHVRDALRAGKPSLVLPVADHTTFHLKFEPVAGADRLSESEREALHDELAVRMGQQLAYLSMTWHEVQTWYGYKSVGLVSEKASAFTYDDLMSHVVGVNVAGEAMRISGAKDLPRFDAAVTVALNDEMRRLGAVGPDETDRAAAAVRGEWWRNGRPVKRQLDTGIATGEIKPWLVPAFAGGPATARAFALPTLTNVRGRDLRGAYEVRIEPQSWEARRIRSILPGRPALLEPARDLPILIEDIRAQLHKESGRDADRVIGRSAVIAHR